MLENLKKQVFEANLELVKQGLVIYTWGNVSGIDREKGYVVIKPSGVSYDEMKAEDMVVVDLEGNIVEGSMNPSSDTPTHLALYKEFSDIGGVVHTHSEWATSWAQAGREIPCYGTTHADYFYGSVPCTRKLTDEEIKGQYELETGNVIIETMKAKQYKPLEMPAIIIFNHGPFSWGKTPKEAVHNAKVLEEVSKMAHRTEAINKDIVSIDKILLDKHYLRKHGANAYYGQKK
ncbi:L-ribulose-5-phosphate 4-epimerase [Clostridium grantii]|uniref:L-ribulose-5-phosphate 4-epimerase n=1 Tax=Clostridium grantii DSM 8605 TaxID=1121316 RepID=A0A1M5XCC2_9CLOT|nr:L-ribulose-5-phosphate 4-epimerase [Clostridium grantii]SHH97389.1 L-ribulose 5-phosphate 4-epimerase [Clostridium grantii DSM 8605]